MNVVFFDGVCNLCNQFVNWLISHDHRKILRYAPLQGETAARSLQPEYRKLETVVYRRDGDTYSRSSAILMILSDLGGIWRLAAVLRLIPSPIRDLAYDWIAKNRYKLFGKRDTCRLPTPEEKTLFLP